MFQVCNTSKQLEQQVFLVITNIHVTGKYKNPQILSFLTEDKFTACTLKKVYCSIPVIIMNLNLS